MAQYISKDALVAEMERKIDLFKKEKLLRAASIRDKLSLGARIAMLEEIRATLNTIEVKEVDLDREIDDWYSIMGIPVTTDALKETAHHFFELGLKATQKGE